VFGNGNDEGVQGVRHVAFAIVAVVKGMNSMRRRKAEAPHAPSKEELLLGEIRDILKERN
jgi:large conductance mechanosensitive channel